MKIIKQINNLRIRWNPLYKKYQVLTFDNRVLEEFNAFPHAVVFCKEKKDFLKKLEGGKK